MMRLIQKLDKFDTNNQKIYQISKFDTSIKNRTLPSVNFSLILTNQRRENSPNAILHCRLKWNELVDTINISKVILKSTNSKNKLKEQPRYTILKIRRLLPTKINKQSKYLFSSWQYSNHLWNSKRTKQLASHLFHP
jgi:hypothetical protein